MICVTGMHRSGTSMVCQLMEQLGVDFGDPARFYAADRWNEAGYYEIREVIDTNSRLITGFPRTRGSIAGALSKLRYLTMPPPDAIARRLPALEGRMEELAAELGDLAVKDPRFCLTLGGWERIRPMRCVVVSVRHPIEVAASLRRRQRIPLGRGYRFWDYHMRQLIGQVSPGRCIFVDFNRLADEDRLRQIRPLVHALGLERTDDECKRAIESVFDAKLVHCIAHDASRMPATTRELWSQVNDLADRCRERWAATPAADR